MTGSAARHDGAGHATSTQRRAGPRKVLRDQSAEEQVLSFQYPTLPGHLLPAIDETLAEVLKSPSKKLPPAISRTFRGLAVTTGEVVLGGMGWLVR